ncbi:GNAT family N-acetyltransferase [Novosphingobium sp. G106]|uniref:GNAT family N-acetyltransferase n=1 Tax=Novosphingobium sp. G106 TaxID=2849500 RepID=UPI001C2CDD8B|nr:GNAT family N-acetyltransferase [Novosphingobium sp. G106]MBV1687813.1 GNAT family N-acetyltransferase [Novosphingobium sp. G106]
MFIRTARLFLRPCWPEDRQEMLTLINEAPLAANASGLPWPLTAEDAQRFIERPSDKRLPHFFITLPRINGGELIGGIGLGPDGDEVGLGYWIIKAHHGHGYATEAISAVLSMARTLGHTRIIASHIPGDGSSAHVLEKVGFKPTSELRSRLATAGAGMPSSQTFLVDLSASIELEDNAPLARQTKQL